MPRVMLNPHSPVPLYHQLKEALLAEVQAGRWRPHEVIPPERVLIDRYGISRTTVRQALAELTSEGVLYRRHGKGTFVAPPRPLTQSLSQLTGHVEELHLLGLAVTTRVLQVKDKPAPAQVATALAMDKNSPALYIQRLVELQAEPLLLMAAWLPISLGVRFTRQDLEEKPIYQLLEERGIFPDRGEQRIRATGAAAAEARLLQLPPGHPVLEVTRRVYTAHNQPIEWSRALYHPDRYAYAVELRRGRHAP